MTNKTGVETPVNLPSEDITLPIENNKLIELQKEDKFCKNILNMLASNKLQNKNPYYIESGILKWYIDENKQRFEVIVLPQTLTQPALQLAHEGLGHNGIPQTYNSFEVPILLERFKTLCDQTHQAMHSLSET